ncbi:MAG: hypothetical protein KA198_09495 [Chitinophagaceae bacterium]|nr:hypothetical protein [Chitinophagaceae bacterium]
MKKVIVFSCLISLVVIMACNKKGIQQSEYLSDTPKLPQIPFDYQARFETLFKFQSSLNNNLATLGRVLFYDRHLSANNTVSCGSCHQQSKGFTDGAKFSDGLILGKTTRNTPAICNAAQQSHLFWDGRETNLENMVLKPIENHVEMGVMDLNSIVSKVSALEYYKPLFQHAFSSETVTKERIALGLQEFVKSIVSFQNKNETITTVEDFNMDERVGRQLFAVSLPCLSCHNSENNSSGWSGSSFANIGLDEHYTDKGAQDLFGSSNQDSEGFFKVPSLRNVALTAPYMHDGRFKTLEEVVDFYTQNIQPHKNLNSNLTTGSWFSGGGIGPFNPFINDPVAAKLAEVKSNATGAIGQPLRFELSEYQKKCLVSYLKTFTDPVLITAEMYSDPFRK